jgi:hypothetical protein
MSEGRRRGIPLDGAQFDYELARRGLQAAQLAELAGVSEHLVGRARRGVPIAPESLSAIAKALSKVKPLAGVSDLIGAVE